MKYFPLLMIVLFVTACGKSDEKLRDEMVQEAMEVLPGEWDISEISLLALGSTYTNAAGIFRDTTIRDFGTIEFGEFYQDTIFTDFETFSSDVIFRYQDYILDSSIEQLFSFPGGLQIYFRDNSRSSEDWDTKFGEFMENIFLFRDNHELVVIKDTKIEIYGTGRAVEKAVLRRKK